MPVTNLLLEKRNNFNVAEAAVEKVLKHEEERIDHLFQGVLF